MKNWFLAGVAAAASMALSCPVLALQPTDGRTAAASVQSSLWLNQGRSNAGAQALIGVLRRAPLDGLDSGPALAARAETLLQRAAAGDPAAASEADQLLSTAWTHYVQTLERRAPGMDYADGWAAPRQHSAPQILAKAKAAPSLARHIVETSAVNPLYAQLRDAAWSDMQISGGRPDTRVLASLERVRHVPATKRYVVIDAASSNLWMVEGNAIVGSMPVITGDAGNRTPMIASTIYYATLNPYWNVPEDMVRTMIAPRVAEQGVTYLTERDYEVFESAGKNAPAVDPSTVDWAAVAAGSRTVKLRRKPGEWNSMGRMKFGFANASDIFLHDTPTKELFAQADRNLSHGCIRLSDAPRLARWMLGREAIAASAEPEQHVALPAPVPIYITYLTAHAADGRIAFVDDVYGLDSGGTTRVAGLR